MTGPLSVLPAGTFPLEFAPTAAAALGSSKRAADGEVVAFKYTFKPASITHQTSGSVEPTASGGRIVAFDEVSSGGSQVFEVREEPSKSRECVIVWDQGRQAFVLHALPATYHLKVDRNLSAQRATSGPPNEEERKRLEEEARKKARTSDSEESRDSSPGTALPARGARTALSASTAAPVPASTRTPPKKKAAPKKAAAAAAAAAAAEAQAERAKPTKAKGKTKAAPKAKATPKKKAAATKAAASKIKSVETLEDSDEAEDDFETLLRKEMAQEMAPQEQTASQLPGYDDDDEEEEEEDEDDELGGAQYASYQNDRDDVEWI